MERALVQIRRGVTIDAFVILSFLGGVAARYRE
jgi:hypothetical protein